LPTLFAPTTLSVETRTWQSSSIEQALRADVNNLSMADAFISRGAVDLPWISGPSARLGRIISAVIASGGRLPFETPHSHLNTSYETEAFLPVLNCTTANSTVCDDIVRFVNETRVANVQNVTTDSLKWMNSRIPASGEIGFLGLSYPRTLEHYRSGLNWNNTQQTTNEFAFTIQRSPTDIAYQSDTEFLSCEVWNATVSYKVETRNRIVSIGSVRRELLNRFDPVKSMVKYDDWPGNGSPACSGYTIGLAGYLLGYIGWTKDMRTRLYSTGPLGATFLSTGAQYYNMNRNMNEAGLVVSTLQNPSSVRNISFREDVEAFALNVSLSMTNDDSLWLARVPTNSLSRLMYRNTA
jgi:hypothetical protein